jgi:ribosome recycling factor
MVLIRASLKEGNDEIKKTIKDSKHDKAKTFDNIIGMILDNCINTITENDMEKVKFIYYFFNYI